MIWYDMTNDCKDTNCIYITYKCNICSQNMNNDNISHHMIWYDNWACYDDMIWSILFSSQPIHHKVDISFHVFHVIWVTYLYDFCIVTSISYHIIYVMTWHREIIWNGTYYMTWYDVISREMIRYDTIWYDPIWYDVIWRDMTWYDILHTGFIWSHSFFLYDLHDLCFHVLINLILSISSDRSYHII